MSYNEQQSTETSLEVPVCKVYDRPSRCGEEQETTLKLPININRPVVETLTRLKKKVKSEISRRSGGGNLNSYSYHAKTVLHLNAFV